MPTRPIILFPHSGLRQPAAVVQGFGPDIAALATDLHDTLSAVSAIGITAPHVGVARRVVVIRMRPLDEVRTYVNPTLLASSMESDAHEEGSVSMPGVCERIERPGRVRVGYQDVAGYVREAEAEGFEAAVLQHEIDQLDGIFWIDRLSNLKRDRLIKRYEKLRRKG